MSKITLVCHENDLLLRSIISVLSKQSIPFDMLSFKDYCESVEIAVNEQGARVYPDTPLFFRPVVPRAEDPESDEAFMLSEYWSLACSAINLMSSRKIGDYGFKANIDAFIPKSGLDLGVMHEARDQYLCSKTYSLPSECSNLYVQSLIDFGIYPRADTPHAFRAASQLKSDDAIECHQYCVAGETSPLYSQDTGLLTDYPETIKGIEVATKTLFEHYNTDMVGFSYLIYPDGKFQLIDVDPYPPKYNDQIIINDLAALIVSYLSKEAA
ncbi:hypothetical protein [Enterovibrio coralii]|uniref:Uncharacterized protein n=1 Tax=Enterovibrio coralii TaxID=294935 RepID=A0A135I8T0_9GAMM|nr:hypothetical protein [Enterovibrio coralii]KXF81855.1 hypothetical protein ATN88_20385 [Enterovibrio coralii]